MPENQPLKRNCGAMHEHRRLLNESPAYVAARIQLENIAREYELGRRNRRAGITRIPVVVHVLWNKAIQNISDAQIESQIRVLNEDFRKTNPDRTGVPPVWQGLAADSRIEFFLATEDPNGNPSNGITRKQTAVTAFSQVGNQVKFSTSGGTNAWPAETYLNIWVCELGNDLLGYAQFPGGPANTDGVVILHSAFGTTGTAAAPFNKGRTATHEVGHWLNLYHIWGDDGTGCNGSDEVADTPNAGGPNFGCPSFPKVSCNNAPNGDMFMNYMDYTDDSCMFMFTEGQVARMQAALDGPRTSIGVGQEPAGTPPLVLGQFGYSAGAWRIERHLRMVADLSGDGKADLLGFADDGVYLSRNNGNGTFQNPQLVLNNLAYTAGGWRVDMHPRFLADVTGDGRLDIVGFGNPGVFVARNNGNGTFQPIQLVLKNLGYAAGGWRMDKHPRFVADLRGTGRADFLGIGNKGVFVSRNNGDGTFQAAEMVLEAFGYEADWRIEKHPRMLADTTGDGLPDIVAFGNEGVYVARNLGNGNFQMPQLVLNQFGYDAGAWRVEMHPRFLADTTGDGRPDIVGFANDGVRVARNNGDGTFQAAQLVLNSFGYNAGDWRVDQHPRFLVDVTGDGKVDIIGFANDGVYIAYNNGNGTFQAPKLVLNFFGLNAGWQMDRHPRLLADLSGDGKTDIVGFGNEGVYLAANKGNGVF